MSNRSLSLADRALSGLPCLGERKQRHALHHAAAYHQGDSRSVPGVRVRYHRHQHLLLVSLTSLFDLASRLPWVCVFLYVLSCIIPPAGWWGICCIYAREQQKNGICVEIWKLFLFMYERAWRLPLETAPCTRTMCFHVSTIRRIEYYYLLCKRGAGGRRYQFTTNTQSPASPGIPGTSSIMVVLVVVVTDYPGTWYRYHLPGTGIIYHGYEIHVQSSSL